MRKFTKSNQLVKKVEKVIPLASQTFSKSHLVYVGKSAPLFLTHGKAARVWDIDGNEYVDFVNGLLPIILGYQYPAVDAAIQKQLKNGIVFSLPSPLEYELAALLVKLIPCAEMVRFAKNGSDATSGAIRLARACTGRDHVAVCGYHGWQDWYIGSTTRHLGVPNATRALTHKFDYNDISSLEEIFKKNKNKVAAVILEPMNTDEPQKNFLEKVKNLTHKNGALLVFDETITGFRYSLGGAQKFFGVTPDLATFGKSIANGMPISALVGKRKYMKRVEDIFFSGTFGGETLSIAAALATIREMQRKPILKKIWQNGRYLQTGTRKLLKQAGLGEIIKLTGKPCWQIFIFSGSHGYTGLELKTYIQQEMLQAGFLWSGAHNMQYGHTMADIKRMLRDYERVFTDLKRLLEEKKLGQHLVGKPIGNVFKVR